jgi:hypothetical protein
MCIQCVFNVFLRSHQPLEANTSQALQINNCPMSMDYNDSAT